LSSSLARWFLLQKESVHGHDVGRMQGQLTGKQNLHFLGDQGTQGKIVVLLNLGGAVFNLLVKKLEHSFLLGMVHKAEGSLVHAVAFECAVKDTVVGKLEQPMSFFLVLLEDSFMHITHGIDKLAISSMVVNDPLSFAPAPKTVLHLAKSVGDLCSIGNSTSACASNANALFLTKCHLIGFLGFVDPAFLATLIFASYFFAVNLSYYQTAASKLRANGRRLTIRATRGGICILHKFRHVVLDLDALRNAESIWWFQNLSIPIFHLARHRRLFKIFCAACRYCRTISLIFTHHPLCPVHEKRNCIITHPITLLCAAFEA
jgi:hypothetical protein